MKLTAKQRKSWRRYIAALRRQYPACYPVTVRTVRTPKNICGDTGHANRRIVIRISNRLTYVERVDCLVHEWAHALDRYWQRPEEHWHDEQWGMWYSKCYCCISKASDELKREREQR